MQKKVGSELATQHEYNNAYCFNNLDMNDKYFVTAVYNNEKPSKTCILLVPRDAKVEDGKYDKSNGCIIKLKERMCEVGAFKFFESKGKEYLAVNTETNNFVFDLEVKDQNELVFNEEKSHKGLEIASGMSVRNGELFYSRVNGTVGKLTNIVTQKKLNF